LLGVWRMLPVARCMSFVVRCMLPAACRMLSRSCLLHAACRQVHFPRFMLDVVRYIFPDACCMLSMVCCTFSSGRLRHCCPLDRVCVPFLCCTSHVLRRLLPISLPQCPMSHGVRCLSPGSRRISVPVPSRMSSVACRVWPVAE
jgi:hypothetical protein